MRRPLRKAALGFAAALAGGVAFAVGLAEPEGLDDAVLIGLGTVGIMLLVFGLVFGATALLAGIGEARLRRGIGAFARWTIDAPAWEAFRAFDAQRGAEGPGLRNDYTPRPAEAPVEVLFGRRQAIVDGSYHPLRRWAVPELTWVGWQQPPGAPECLEFGLLYPAGRSGSVPMTLRVPVAPTARDDAVRVFHHYRARIPPPRIGLAFRRPRLVIGWGLGVTAASAAAGGIGWLMAEAGSRHDAVLVLTIFGIMGAIGAAVFTAIVVLVVWPWRKG
jgi:hypothetical protein